MKTKLYPTMSINFSATINPNTSVTMKTNTSVTMKTMLFLAAILCLLIQPALASTELTERIPAEPGQTLKVSLQTGATVNVRTWSENAIEARMQVLEATGGDVQLTLSATSDGGEIRSSFRSPRNGHMVRTRIVIDVMVPKVFNLEISSSGGVFNVAGLRGSLNGRSSGGTLVVSDMQGDVNFHTGGGGVTILNSRLNTSISAGGGQIHVDNSVIDGGISTGGGSIMVSNSTVNGGTKTGGGDITADGIRGNFSAGTGAGNIRVTLAETGASNDLNLSLGTGSGEVRVMVPKGIDPEIFVELAYTMRKMGADIMSDFALEIEKTKEWDDSKGTPRKYIYGKTAGNNPAQQIRIRNTNGNVVLKKY
jgi:hypothetical protein